MGKHNGKARSTGLKVGQALAKRVKQGGPVIGGQRHTTDTAPQTNMQSVLERNDLEELMAMADLQDRDFIADREQVVVISSGTVDPLALERDAAARKESEERNAHKLKLPRRPAWDSRTTPEQLDLQERTSFLDWRRQLAQLEEVERLCLTPFEKNLEVWRQLWRVLERSDIVVQVVDARDPLLYRCEDLELYAREIHASKDSFILLNKADLLPPAVRSQWADYLDAAGLEYAFWSAAAALEEQQRLRQEAAAAGGDGEAAVAQGAAARAAAAAVADGHDERIHVLSTDELLDMFEQRARAAIDAAGDDDPRKHDDERRLMVGLVGYPNVGKSSTINAIFGSKKTAVAPTPGKTKHFQTLNVSPTVCLCDCPGLVFPKFAKSKAEMVAAGVIPIDRLTEMRAPVDVAAQRAGRRQLEAVYGIKTPRPPQHDDPRRPPTAAELLRALAAARGWTAAGGLPDETRCGRQILKDYVAGKLLYCLLPPGAGVVGVTPFSAAEAADLPDSARNIQAAGGLQSDTASGSETDGDDDGATSSGDDGGDSAAAAGGSGRPHSNNDAAGASSSGRATATDIAAGVLDGGPQLTEGDLELFTGMQVGPKPKDRRPDWKFQRKPARTKGNRGQAPESGHIDGAAIITGKKGGLVRVGGY